MERDSRESRRNISQSTSCSTTTATVRLAKSQKELDWLDRDGGRGAASEIMTTTVTTTWSSLIGVESCFITTTEMAHSPMFRKRQASCKKARSRDGIPAAVLWTMIATAISTCLWPIT